MDAVKRNSLLRERVRETLRKPAADVLRGRDLFDVITSSKRNVSVLGELLSDPEPVVRILAAACMCRIFRNGGDISRFRPKLEELMISDPDETVRMHAGFVNTNLERRAQARRTLATAESRPA